MVKKIQYWFLILFAVAFVLVVGNIILAETPVRAIDVTLSANTTEEEARLVSDALGVFRENCKPLFQSYKADIENIEATGVIDAACQYDHWCETYGWAQWIGFRIKVKDDPQKIPYAVAAGHTLHYKLGAGHSPGISAAKDVSAILCGWRPNEDNSDLFTPVPELAFIDD